MFTIIMTILVSVLIGFLGGVYFVLRHYVDINNKYKHLPHAENFDSFKQDLDYLSISNILDIAHAFGYNEGREFNSIKNRLDD